MPNGVGKKLRTDPTKAGARRDVTRVAPPRPGGFYRDPIQEAFGAAALGGKFVMEPIISRLDEDLERAIRVGARTGAGPVGEFLVGEFAPLDITDLLGAGLMAGGLKAVWELGTSRAARRAAGELVDELPLVVPKEVPEKILPEGYIIDSQFETVDEFLDAVKTFDKQLAETPSDYLYPVKGEPRSRIQRFYPDEVREDAFGDEIGDAIANAMNKGDLEPEDIEGAAKIADDFLRSIKPEDARDPIEDFLRTVGPEDVNLSTSALLTSPDELFTTYNIAPESVRGKAIQAAYDEYNRADALMRASMRAGNVPSVEAQRRFSEASSIVSGIMKNLRGLK